MPLVNAHTHLELTWAAHHCPPAEGQPFAEWIHGLLREWIPLMGHPDGEKKTLQAVEDGIALLHAAGTTHVGDISNTFLSIEPLLASGLAGVVYLEVIGLGREESLARFEQARDLIERFRPRERNGMRLGLSPHAPYSTHPDAFGVTLDYALREDVPLCVHLAESPAERQALVEGGGPLHQVYAPFGDNRTSPQPGVSPVRYLVDLGVLEARPLLVHMIDVDEADLALVAASGSKVVHCPRSNGRLRCGRLPLERYLAHNIPVALGTDSLASSPSLDVRDEATAAVALHAGFVDESAVLGLLPNTAVLV